MFAWMMYQGGGAGLVEATDAKWEGGACATAGLAQWTVLAPSLVSCAPEKVAVLTAW